jgi:DNA-binding response OmpR family regulator
MNLASMEPIKDNTAAKRILLIDDEEAVRMTVAEILRRAGYEVQSAADGKSGLELFQRQSFDLLITDLLMPERDGLETIMALRRGRAPLKILVISGCGQTLGSEYMQIARHLGADYSLPKPFTRVELLAVVARLLDVPSTPAG